MSVKLTPSGDWEFSTPAEAAEFQRLQRWRAAPPKATEVSSQERPARARRRGRPPTKGLRGIARRTARATAASQSVVLSDGSRQILETVRLHHNGLQSEEFARAIGSPNMRAVPVRMMTLRKELKALGLKPYEVIGRERVYVKGRARSVFKPGPRLDEALRRTGDLFAVAK